MADENVTKKTANSNQISDSNVSVGTSNGDSKVEEMMSPGEKLIYAKLNSMYTEVKTMQKTIIELAQQAVIQTVKENDKCLKRLKKDQLKGLGLPLENVTQMNSFERNLKNDDFYDKTVCSLSTNQFHFI